MRGGPKAATYSQAAQHNRKGLIRIETASTGPPSRRQHAQGRDEVRKMLYDEIEEIRKRVINSKIVLQDSRKQQSSVEKLVESDRMGLVFNHADSAGRAIQQELHLKSNLECQLAAATLEPEGQIQLPLHLDSSTDQLHPLSSRNHFDDRHARPHYFPSGYQQKKQKMLLLQDFRRKYSKDKQSKELIPRHQGKKISEEAAKHLNARKYKEIFGRSKDLIQYKEGFNKSLEDKKSHNYKTEVYFLNQSHERLPIYVGYQKSLSKERKENIKALETQKLAKAKIKLNNPNINQPSRYGNIKPNLKPRYQIQIPKQAKQTSSIDSNTRDKVQNREWEELKEKVQRFEFVRRHLSEGDLFEIYEYLKRNRVGPDKWPLFVVDEAYKRMNMPS